MHPSRRRLLAAACALPCAAAFPAEPPSWPALSCRVVAQSFSGTLRLQVQFHNQGTAAIELPPGPHLVHYADTGASDALETTARLDRVQRAPVVVPAGGSRQELFVVEAAQAEAMRCPPRRPAATGLYFYRFSPRPQSRCVLEAFDASAWTDTVPCAGTPRTP